MTLHLRESGQGFVSMYAWYMSDVLSLRVPNELKERLDRLSADTHRPASWYVREALEKHLEDVEDYYDAVAIYQRIAAGGGNVVSLEEARKELL